MNTAAQQLMESARGGDPQPEALNAVELVYSAYLRNGLSYSLAGFYNDMEVIAWNETINQTTPVGDLHLFGIEPEVSYSWSRGTLGINYSYTKQLEWQLAPDVTLSGISYSDYNFTLRNTNAVLQGLGNDLNNWPNQALKLFGRLSFLKRFILHLDARFLWDFQGAKDGLAALERALRGQPEEAAALAALGRVEDEDVFGMDFRLNGALTYLPLEGLEIQLFSQNLLGLSNNKRYSYDEGISKPGPHKMRFIEEPRSVGVQVAYTY
jgi:hypothetical protein